MVMTLCVTATVILFGEVLPKALAKEMAESYTLRIAAPLSIIGVLLTPISALFTLISRLVTKLFAKTAEPTVTEDDVIDIIEDMEEEGSLDSDESRLLYSAFEFGDVTVNDIYTDRRDIICIDVELCEEEILNIVKNSPYSRIPVYRGDIDNCIGILRIREYLESYIKGLSPDLKTLLDPPFFVTPETKIDELLSDMKRLRKQLAIVKTRSGRVIGIVTMEDMLEELVGEIWDENDRIEDKFRQTDENTFEISADFSVVSAFEMMDYEDYDREECGHYTLRKWMGRMLGRVPSVGSKCSYRRLDITAEKVFRGRLISLIFKINSPADDETREDEE
jgi:CBS domain containing-hemolysin-like protein